VTSAQPAAHLGNPLASHAQLSRALSRIGHRQHKNLVALAARAFRATFGVSAGALQQPAPQQLAGDRQFADQLLARAEDLLPNHSQE
jgi:hypothetical protein